MSNDFNETVEALFKGMDNFVTTKTIVGDAIHIGDTIILFPLRLEPELLLRREDITDRDPPRKKTAAAEWAARLRPARFW